jgi:anti-sigma regulatory factor (Ser/Thr protein kinase)
LVRASQGNARDNYTLEELGQGVQPAIIPVSEASQVAEARRAGLKLAKNLDWDETAAGKLGIVLTEIGTNLTKHAKRGQIHIQTCARNGAMGIEVLAFDRGPGIASIEDCLKDGYSTAATSGTGLGAMARLTDEFDIYSQKDLGTCLVARLFSSSSNGKASPRPRPLAVGSVRVPAPGETECGDNWGVRAEEGRTVILLADGLGHGPGAAEASGEAVAALQRANDLAPTAVLEQVHHALRSTRGAAVAIAQVDVEKEQVRFAGAGNISAMIISPAKLQHMISHNGTAGHNVRKFQEFVYPWTEQTVLVMHSDGITTSWRLDAYSGIIRRDPSLLAAVLIRDASRGRDDACVVAARDRE